ncbi:MAG: hypothetical protein RLZZ480_105 [Candidatus Parcubacteria bacterium]|jgi:hypothetical protein
MEEQTHKEIDSCKNSVMSRIECGKVCPRSKTFFLCKEGGMWLLWGASVIVGALAVAVTLFVIAHRQYGLYEATHDNFLTFMVDVLPFLWIGIFGLMVFAGVYEFRHLKRGYRYPLWQIFGSSMVLSLAGGAALHFLGMGYTTDHMLGQRMHMYNSQEKIEKRLWQNPEDGRLLGRQTESFMPPSTTIEFTDVHGEQWRVDITDLTPEELKLLETEQQVRLLGMKLESEQMFHSCGVFVWDLDKPEEDFAAAREGFLIKLHSFEERAERTLQGSDLDGDEEEGETPCAHIAPVKRARQAKS